MKKLLCVFLTLTMFCTVPVMASDNITVKINNETINFDINPQIINGSTYVPMRTIFEKLGAIVTWDSGKKAITGTKDNTSVYMIVGENKITVNGKEIGLDSPAKVVNGSTLVPVRVIAESFSCDVNWDKTTKVVSINTDNINTDTKNSQDEQSNSNKELTIEEEFENLTTEQKEVLWQYATLMVSQYLKCPSTAIYTKYSDGTSFSLITNKASGEHKLYIMGYVDSQNGFGAMLRSKFTVRINCETTEIESISIDGDIVYWND